MRKREPELYFADILSAIDDVRDYVGKKTKAQFIEDKKTQDAVIRKLGVIGEASGHLPKAFRENNKRIKWENVSGMRNILVHEYFGVDLDLVWKTVKEDLTVLKRIIKEAKE